MFDCLMTDIINTKTVVRNMNFTIFCSLLHICCHLCHNRPHYHLIHLINTVTYQNNILIITNNHQTLIITSKFYMTFHSIVSLLINMTPTRINVIILMITVILLLIKLSLNINVICHSLIIIIITLIIYKHQISFIMPVQSLSSLISCLVEFISSSQLTCIQSQSFCNLYNFPIILFKPFIITPIMSSSSSKLLPSSSYQINVCHSNNYSMLVSTISVGISVIVVTSHHHFTMIVIFIFYDFMMSHFLLDDATEHFL